MKVKIRTISAGTKVVEYDVYKDDGTTLIQSGESVDYSAAIPNPAAAAFTDFAGLVVADAAAKKDALIANLTTTKTANTAQIAALTSANTELDSQITDLGTSVSAFA